jgi:peroxiredoxin
VKSYGVYNSSNGYAIPSVFIVDTDGVIRWEFSGSTSHRADNNEIIAQLKELS